MKGPKLDPPGGTTFDFKGVHFLTPLETRFLCTGVQNWTLNRLNPVPPCRSGFKPIQAPSSAALFQCRNASNQHRVGNKSLEQGRPQLRLQKSYQFQVPKTNPRLAPCTCLSWSQSFLFCSVNERGPVFPKPAIEALRGSARPGRGHASDPKRIGTRT
jgi:hypothetical protein